MKLERYKSVFSEAWQRKDGKWYDRKDGKVVEVDAPKGKNSSGSDSKSSSSEKKVDKKDEPKNNKKSISDQIDALTSKREKLLSAIKSTNNKAKQKSFQTQANEIFQQLRKLNSEYDKLK